MSANIIHTLNIVSGLKHRYNSSSLPICINEYHIVDIEDCVIGAAITIHHLSVLAIEHHTLLQPAQDLLCLAHVRFDSCQRITNFAHQKHCLADVAVNVMRVPIQTLRHRNEITIALSDEMEKTWPTK